MWIDTGSSRLPEGTEDQLRQQKVVREDRSDYVWVNIDTGTALILACNGGWRTAGKSGFQLFLRAPGGVGPLIDVTFGLLGTSYVEFDANQTGSDTYSPILRSLMEKVTKILDAHQSWQPAASV
ncbi:MAG: hypothetical protein EPN48_12520 [Microbacteriaceae bacterium]|nr:MAG: hypothetical protein EPN48_12520 [Microbacteriaceae bacterium]